MKSQTPKVLHKIGGKELLFHVIDTVRNLGISSSALVTSKTLAPKLKAHVNLPIFVQDPPLGTGHALLSAEPFFKDQSKDVLVLYGDTPLITTATLQRMIDLKNQQKAGIILLTMEMENPHGYGRVMKDPVTNEVLRIVEEKEASPEEKSITLCNSGFLLMDREVLPLLHEISNDNAKGEYYLTDIVGTARNHGYKILETSTPPQEVYGINTLMELSKAESIFQERRRGEMMENGVTLQDPESVYFSSDTILSPGVRIEPHVFFGKGVKIGACSTVHAFSYLEGVQIGENVSIGPFARIRPNSQIESGAKVGNFVEVKNTIFGKGSKAGHLSYLGDTTLGENVNIGAGTITCNYDGFKKHKTTIHANAFIGSNTALVAPIEIGEGSIVGAGSTLTKSTPKDTLAISRPPQVNKVGKASIIRSRKIKS